MDSRTKEDAIQPKIPSYDIMLLLIFGDVERRDSVDCRI